MTKGFAPSLVAELALLARKSGQNAREITADRRVDKLRVQGRRWSGLRFHLPTFLTNSRTLAGSA